jgi:hypothetical protein
MLLRIDNSDRCSRVLEWFSRTFLFARQIRTAVRRQQKTEATLAPVRASIWGKISQLRQYHGDNFGEFDVDIAIDVSLPAYAKPDATTRKTTIATTETDL